MFTFKENRKFAVEIDNECIALNSIIYMQEDQGLTAFEAVKEVLIDFLVIPMVESLEYGDLFRLRDQYLQSCWLHGDSDVGELYDGASRVGKTAVKRLGLTRNQKFLGYCLDHIDLKDYGLSLDAIIKFQRDPGLLFFD